MQCLVIANIRSVLYTLKFVLRKIIENLKAEINFLVCHQGLIIFLKSITVSSISNCQKYEENITVKTLQCLHFLSITHDVITYVCIIVCSSNNNNNNNNNVNILGWVLLSFETLRLWFATLHCDNPWASNNTNALKVKSIVIINSSKDNRRLVS